MKCKRERLKLIEEVRPKVTINGHCDRGRHIASQEHDQRLERSQGEDRTGKLQQHRAVISCDPLVDDVPDEEGYEQPANGGPGGVEDRKTETSSIRSGQPPERPNVSALRRKGSHSRNAGGGRGLVTHAGDGRGDRPRRRCGCRSALSQIRQVVGGLPRVPGEGVA